ncbi:energy-coupling factor ABC transporter ATP-binding protein [Melissococcus plutonius]|uniref:ATPase component of general energizing moduleof ECF transporters n=1 Tax=Melissococcus plutonius (strain ATCC 35311 / DSM 29964 / CIP 104052 / LMG 20360 / NCIMB 702443) TaxID=940190 RepID=F3Y828_MELPT|nr:energy-coupling factor ABC transporter ATP-binding protein [Melissococcus plutonius]AIM24409.1 energy-coupling factor transporter ATP-binding protein EcfA [Melissococcus plutonius S1]KMT25800.1 energy-coupling factor transporter ATP-binding protein EcfA [Melissococcus plutonius]KMT27145.1 energy-coupling factor transporter ATP-binding protein EcfA [Melissococcus plutonius]KMT28246.1 energy-coupling factor transporter ATP-binding protein EcfA [Melissococcus plutonius]KMT29983.1 energy-coupli
MQPIIELKNISFSYQPEDTPILKNISFSIKKGEWIAIVGHNGSGKSTLAKTINGLLLPDEGDVIIDGNKLNEANIWEIRQKVGMVFQNPDNQFVGATVEDDIAFGLENQGIPRDEMVLRVKNALEKVRMTEFVTREPAHLSGGQKQRVAIAGIVALRPAIIILDEATSMLDPEGREEVIATIRAIKEKNNLTVISITHDISEATHADRILVMKQGELIKVDTPKQIFANEDQLANWGLDIPFSEKLKKALKKYDIELPEEYLPEERLVDWLWTFVLNK